jgi:hypothetical protein
VLWFVNGSGVYVFSMSFVSYAAVAIVYGRLLIIYGIDIGEYICEVRV